jgi:hypothetical protein
MAKWWTTELQKRVVDQCVQLHGGYGYMLEYPVAKAFVDSPRADHLRRDDRGHEGDHRSVARRLEVTDPVVRPPARVEGAAGRARPAAALPELPRLRADAPEGYHLQVRARATRWSPRTSSRTATAGRPASRTAARWRRRDDVLGYLLTSCGRPGSPGGSRSTTSSRCSRACPTRCAGASTAATAASCGCRASAAGPDGVEAFMATGLFVVVGRHALPTALTSGGGQGPVRPVAASGVQGRPSAVRASRRLSRSAARSTSASAVALAAPARR